MLTVAQLHKEREERARVNHETYKQLHEQVQNRIRARDENKFTDLIWQVPPFVPGRPVYAVSHAARYVSEKLRRGGFEVNVVVPKDDMHVLCISWKKARRQPRRQQRSEPRPAAAAPAFRTNDLDEASRTLEKLKARLRVGR